jgi:hypothetical protein
MVMIFIADAIFIMKQLLGKIRFAAKDICKMKRINKLIIIEGIIFLIAGVITALLGRFTAEKYGTVLLLCGLATMAIGIFSQAGSRHRPMPHSYRPKTSVSEQHQKDKKELQASTTTFLNLAVVGSIPVAIGLLLMHFS